MSGAWSDEIPPYLVVGTPGGQRIEIGPGDVIKIYNAANQLVAELSEAGLQVFGTDGSQVAVFAGAVSEITIEPAGGNVNPAIIGSGVTGGGSPQLVIESPQQTLTSPNSRASIIMQGANAGFPQSFINIGADNLQLVGLAGTTGVGSAVLDMGNDQGLPAGINLGISGGSGIGIDGGGLSIANNITLNTQTIDLFLSEIDLNGNRAYILTANDNFPCSLALGLGAGAAPIAGCSHTYINLAAGTQWTATLVTDATNGAAAGVTTIGELTVSENGGAAATKTGQALWRAGAVINSGSMPSQQWTGVFVAGGSLAFQATGKCIGGGVNAFQAIHTTLRIQIFQ